MDNTATFRYRLTHRQLRFWNENLPRRDGRTFKSFTHDLAAELTEEAGLVEYVILSPAGYYLAGGRPDAVRHAA